MCSSGRGEDTSRLASFSLEGLDRMVERLSKEGVGLSGSVWLVMAVLHCHFS